MNRRVSSHPTRGGQQPLGASLVEVAVCLLLVGVVLVAALDNAGSAARTTMTASLQLEGHTYATELMAEVLAMPYHDPDAADADENWGIESDEPSPAASRLTLDDLDDYDGWTESTDLTWRDGAVRAGTTGWTRTVSVDKIDQFNPATVLSNSATDTGLRRATVTVTSPTGDVTTLQALRSVLGGMQQAPDMDTTFVTGVVLEVQTTAAAASGATAVLNHASGP